MTRFSIGSLVARGGANLLFFLLLLTLAACGSAPARTETTRTTSVERPESGGEVRRDTTQTTEVAVDGSQTTERNESTQTTTPPPGSDR